MDRGLVLRWADVEQIWRHSFYNELRVLPEDRYRWSPLLGQVEKNEGPKLFEVLHLQVPWTCVSRYSLIIWSVCCAPANVGCYRNILYCSWSRLWTHKLIEKGWCRSCLRPLEFFLCSWPVMRFYLCIHLAVKLEWSWTVVWMRPVPCLFASLGFSLKSRIFSAVISILYRFYMVLLCFTWFLLCFTWFLLCFTWFLLCFTAYMFRDIEVMIATRWRRVNAPTPGRHSVAPCSAQITAGGTRAYRVDDPTSGGAWHVAIVTDHFPGNVGWVVTRSWFLSHENLNVEAHDMSRWTVVGASDQATCPSQWRSRSPCVTRSHFLMVGFYMVLHAANCCFFHNYLSQKMTGKKWKTRKKNQVGRSEVPQHIRLGGSGLRGSHGAGAAGTASGALRLAGRSAGLCGLRMLQDAGGLVPTQPVWLGPCFRENCDWKASFCLSNKVISSIESIEVSISINQKPSSLWLQHLPPIFDVRPWGGLEQEGIHQLLCKSIMTSEEDLQQESWLLFLQAVHFALDFFHWSPCFQNNQNGLVFQFGHLNKCTQKISQKMSTTFQDLFSNIVLAGGTTMFPGLPERLEKELQALAPTPIEVVALERRNLSFNWLNHCWIMLNHVIARFR